MFVIEKGVPKPDKKGMKAKYPLGQMEVGDSFLIPTEGKDAQRSVQTECGSHWTRLKPKKFASRQVEGGVRIWRVQ